MITVLETARTSALTTLAAVRAALKLTDTQPNPDQDARLARYIDRASRAIVHALGYYPFRESVEERLTGSGRTELMVSRTPVQSVESVTNDVTGETVSLTDVRVLNADAGLIWRRGGWGDDRPVQWGLGVYPEPVPQTGDQPWLVRYTAGEFSPADNVSLLGWGVIGSSGILAAPAGAPALPLLASGERVRLTGLDDETACRDYRVLERSSGLLRLQGLTGNDVVANGNAWLVVGITPLMATLESLAIMTVVAWEASSDRDPSVTSEKIGDWSVTYRGQDTRDEQSGLLPPQVALALKALSREA